MRNRYSLQNRHHDFNIERFKTRLTAKCCVVFVAVTQIIIRIIVIIITGGLPPPFNALYIASFCLLSLIALIVCFEYLLFKRIGPKVMNYSKIIDITLLIIFTAEWILLVLTNLILIDFLPSHTIPVSTVFGYIDFAWRTLFLLFLIQGWKLLIIPPILSISLVIAYTIHSPWTPNIYPVLFGFPEVFYIIMMLYFLDKIKWKEVFTNTQQERWAQINQFVLNNIPENILILDLSGAVNFVSDYCQSFMRKTHLSQNPQDLFTSIVDLYQQPETEPSSPSNTSTRQGQIERVTTSHAMLEPNTGSRDQRIDNLQDLIEEFKNTIQSAVIRQRQFLIYNGRLKAEDESQKKSIEIKISHIQQYGRDFIILIIRDMTQRDLLVTLEDSNKYKDQLLASVSHELRTPLNGTINLVESALEDKTMPTHLKDGLLIPALRSSKFLLHLINDILDMSQIKAHKLRLIFKTRSLRETLKDTLQLVELQAKKKGIELLLEINQDIHDSLFTDHVRLSQIVLNLLNNAIKFTQKGSITLSAVPIEDTNLMKLSVRDTGIGMTEENIKKLFSDYTHIEFAERKEINPTGIGLGLNIAYNLAKLLGPSDQQRGITVDSAVGLGSTFSFIVENKEDQLDPQDILIKKPPLSDKSQRGVPDEFEELESNKVHSCFSLNPKFSSSKVSTMTSECSCSKILVVDDNPFNIMALEAVLKSLDFKCDSVFDGQTAIDKILERQKNLCGINCKPYGVVFMDQEMPGMTGSETVQKIKRLQLQGTILPMKIIGCTAHGSVEEIEKFRECGLDSCIQKPIKAHELEKILKGQEP